MPAPENRLRRNRPLKRIAFQMDRLRQASGACNVQLSGGEPTVRDDLPEIIRMAKARGFALIQCNTNGLRLGTEPGYAASLREAGLDSVYLQCDAADDAAHETARKALPSQKLEATGRAAKRESGSCWWRPWRRALTPIVCGRWWKWDCVWGHMSEACIFSHVFVRTLPVAIRWRAARDIARRSPRSWERQSQGQIRWTDFHPPGCENALCSFSAVYRRNGETLELVQGASSCCDCGETPSAAEGARKAKAFAARHWSAPASPAAVGMGMRSIGFWRRRG